MADSEPSQAGGAPPRAPRDDGQLRGRGGGQTRSRGGLRGGEKRDNERGRPPRNRNRGTPKPRAENANTAPLTPADLAAKFGKTKIDGEAEAQDPVPAADKGKEKEAGSAEEEADEDEGPLGLCDLCASKITILALSPCNHRMCHICALRMRALYKTRDCAHCRVSPIPYHPSMIRAKISSLD